MSKPPILYFSFFPALPLSKTLQLGEWCIGTPGPKVPWRSPRFQELARLHLNAFTKEGFKGGALMWHKDRGFDGSMPEPHVWAAIRATVCFVGLDANDHVRHDPNAVHYIITSENAELYTQPIDEERAYVTRQGGGLLKRVLSAGWKIGEETAALPDAVVAVRQPVIPSQRLATALFAALLDSSNPTNRHIGIALEWHRFALSNPTVVSWSQRLISLKTGFEAISGKSKSYECARFLKNLFEDTTRPYREHLPWAGILWSPRERTDLTRTWMQNGRPQSVVRSELEDWFMALGEGRNEIIHEGTLTTHIYEAPPERPLSRYAGPLFWTADRVLREAVKALLGADVLLCAQLKRAKEWEELGALLLAAMDEDRKSVSSVGATDESNTSMSDGKSSASLSGNTEAASDSTDVETASSELADVETASSEPDDDGIEGDYAADKFDTEPDPPPSTPDGAPSVSNRDLSALLAALKCDAANKVRLKKVVAHSASTIERARENARSAKGLWSASFEKRSIVINRAERDVLEAAGAEFPLPRYWDRCD